MWWGWGGVDRAGMAGAMAGRAVDEAVFDQELVRAATFFVPDVDHLLDQLVLL